MSRAKWIGMCVAAAAVLAAAACGGGSTGHPTAGDVRATGTRAAGAGAASGDVGAGAGAGNQPGGTSGPTSAPSGTTAGRTPTSPHATSTSPQANPPSASASAPGTPPSTSTATDPGPTLPGTTAISLASWAGLVLPVNNTGQLTGNTAKVLSPAQLISPWLTGSGGGLLFWAPEGAATTTHSLHARTELESAIKYPVATERHSLTATLEILQLPQSNPEICVAQLHAGGTGGSNPFVMVDYKSGKLYVMVASGTSTPPSFYTLLTNVAVGATFSYQVADNGDGTLTLAASSGSQHQAYTVAVPTVLRGVSGHFSAGDYEQGTTSGGPDDGGKVLFTALSQS